MRALLLIWLLLSGAAAAQTLERALMPGEVSAGHAKYEQECARCHQRFDKAAQTGLCLDCHKETAADVSAKTKMHGRLKDNTCRACHSEHKGRHAQPERADFDHGLTDYKLAGAHKTAKCSACHKPKLKYRQTPKLCNDCHRQDDQEKGHQGHLGAKCDSCHDEARWREARFNHEKTKLPLAGTRHAELKCKECHADKTYQKTPLTCVGCHRKTDEEKGHKGRFGATCEACHSDRQKWKDAKFDHEKSKLPLGKGKHAEAKCESCHIDQNYQRKLTLACQSCHAKDDQAKGHKGRYGAKCESCHNDKSWKEIAFSHDRDTRYALKDKHRQAKCDSCHLPQKGAIYQPEGKLPTKCVGCHARDDEQKGHRGGLGERCESCHNERGWKPANYDHDKTRFPLLDKHKEAKCETCHKGGVAVSEAKLKLPTACITCHRKNDEEKGHKGRYGEKCESCHDARAWKPGTFNHDRDTKYALKGRHAQTKCDACHTPAAGPLYKAKLGSACIACHAKDDKHKNQLGNKCESCHDEKKWTGVVYDHNKSRFLLSGSHARVECRKCHQSVAYKDAPSTCNGCHAKDDKHKGSFGAKCETCHYAGTWPSWDFDHDKTKYPLDGAHRKVGCHDCHKPTLPLPGKPGRACVNCHYKDDVHEGGFSAQCERCHLTNSWKKLRR